MGWIRRFTFLFFSTLCALPVFALDVDVLTSIRCGRCLSIQATLEDVVNNSQWKLKDKARWTLVHEKVTNEQDQKRWLDFHELASPTLATRFDKNNEAFEAHCLSPSQLPVVLVRDQDKIIAKISFTNEEQFFADIARVFQIEIPLADIEPIEKKKEESPLETRQWRLFLSHLGDDVKSAGEFHTKKWIQPQLSLVRNYWTNWWTNEYAPMAKDGYEELDKKSAPFFKKTYEVVFGKAHPELVAQSRQINDFYSEKMASAYPKMESMTRPQLLALQGQLKKGKKALHDSNPFLWAHLSQMPAPLKKTADYFLSMSLANFAETSEEELKDAYQYKQAEEVVDAVMYVHRSMQRGALPHLQKRAEKALEAIRPHVLDVTMQDCYRIIVTKSKEINAFNTGCTVYVTSAVVELMNDAELKATIAHELAHGDHGHYVKNFYILARTATKHYFSMLMEDVDFVLNDKVGPRMKSVIEDKNKARAKNLDQKGGLNRFVMTVPDLSFNNFNVIMNEYASFAPAVEIEADQSAEKILRRAGFKPMSMARPLLKLHATLYQRELDDERHEKEWTEDKDWEIARKSFDHYIGKQAAVEQGTMRDYPTLYKRIHELKKVQ